MITIECGGQRSMDIHVYGLHHVITYEHWDKNAIHKVSTNINISHQVLLELNALCQYDMDIYGSGLHNLLMLRWNCSLIKL